MTYYLPVKAVTFDVGNVLVHWDPRLAYAPYFQGRAEELDYFLNEVCTLSWHSRHDQGIPFAENIRALQNQFPSHAAMIGLYETEWDNMFGGIIEGTVEILHQLQEQQYSLFALTNYAADKFSDFRKKHDFMALFDDIIISGVEKIIKPDPRIYQILLDRSDIAAEQILFIDDRKENLIAAQAFGIQTHLFTNAEALREDLRNRGMLPPA